MNCCPTEAFLVGTEASQALDTNIGHIKWDGRTDGQGLTAANWQTSPDGLDPSSPDLWSQSAFMFQEIVVTDPTNHSLPISD